MNDFDRARERNEGTELAGASLLDAALLVIGYSFPRGTLDRVTTRPAMNPATDATEIIYLHSSGIWHSFRLDHKKMADLEQRSEHLVQLIMWLREAVGIS